MFTSAVIYKQSLLHENGIVQLLHNYKCYSVVLSRFRKPLQRSAKKVKNNYRLFLPFVQFVTRTLELSHPFDKVNKTKFSRK